MKKALTWIVFVGVLFGVFKLASAVGNPWAPANVFAAANAAKTHAEALRIPGCADHPLDCK